GTPLVQIRGPDGTNTFDGLVINAGNSTVRGLALQGFATAIRRETNGFNVVQGNFIGTDLTGTNAASNTLDGIYVNSPRNLIGGTNNVLANLIASTGRHGVNVAAPAGPRNGILGNSIFANDALGIDLGSNGPTPNDSDDSDVGPNNLQNFPVLDDVTSINAV